MGLVLEIPTGILSFYLKNELRNFGGFARKSPNRTSGRNGVNRKK